MRVVSLVPSWTETLLHCGVNVVGRTRFCVHPEALIQIIPAVGGTKDLDWEKLAALKPDLLLLDREENPQAMADEASRLGIKWHATHVHSISSMAGELRLLSQLFPPEQKSAFLDLSERWHRVEEAKAPPFDWSRIPGVLQWIRRPSHHQIDHQRSFVYLIWRHPWMAVGPDTFIGSVLERLGLAKSAHWPTGPARYPEIDIRSVPNDAILLFSSEPYPFARKNDWQAEIVNPCAIVDGESFSWFGLRSLVFLEKALG